MCPSPKDHTHRLYTMMCPNPKDHTPGCIQCVPIQRTTHPAVYNDVSQSKDHTLRLFTTMWSSPKDNRSAGAPRLYTMSQCKGPHKGGTPRLYTVPHSKAQHTPALHNDVSQWGTPAVYNDVSQSKGQKRPPPPLHTPTPHPGLYTMMCPSPKDHAHKLGDIQAE